MIRKLMIAGLLATATLFLPRAEAQTLKLAVTDVEGLERLQTDWGPFRDRLQQATGFTFDFFPVSSRTAAAEALRARRVDLVITGPAEYVVINKMTNATALIGLSRPDYFCALVVRADSPVIRPADLRGKKVAMDDIGSTSGHLCPSQLLADYGVDPQKELGGIAHTSRNVAHEALKRGDVAAIGVNYNSWINSARSKDRSVPAGYFRVIARSGDLPNDVLLAGAHVDAKTIARLREAMIENKQAIAEAIVSAGGENEKYRGLDLVAIEDAAYNRVRQMYATIGRPQFSEFVGK
ncbi:PhnD/SsuA/transferrin family substrate-binding protein [Teichococcus vastitatis]|uniref:PhnD/SsuA/transferrin family substrate-binding protein n=2 Tax=Teichococcus vastitatis TaxID=2307076 RepID=A0ABS9W767_9PROT|nr:PhnD/SsuA/transferrin family substrate-binding protein [Pseudoroseomonas vastitatis]MCI0755133.1 PhnD/SsuA/transferrin family substrate-binding protein [Pseudoroseomonas vastitatis]